MKNIIKKIYKGETIMSEQKDERGVAGVGILVAAFTDEEAGEEALKALKKARSQRQVYFEDAAVIRQDADGEVHYHETGDVTTGKGVGVGAIVGGVIGILGGPAGIALGAGAGALLGGLASKGDAGFDDKSMEQLGVALRPGTSAVMLVTSDAFLRAVQEQTEEAERRASVASLGYGIADQLAEGNNVAMAMLITEEGLAVKEVVANEDAAHVIGVVATEEGWAAGEAVVTEEGVAARRVVATDDAVAGEEAVVTEEGAVVAGFVTTDEGAVAGAAVLTPEQGEEDSEDK
jgi:uncharacterized membrane protein